MPVGEALDPATERWGEPRDLSSRLELPLCRHTLVIDHTDGVDEVSGHDDGTVDSGNHIHHCLADKAEDVLELLNFLGEEDSQWHVLASWKTTWALQLGELFLILCLDEVGRQLLDQILLESHLDLVFLGHA